jgi:hypothetical protein
MMTSLREEMIEVLRYYVGEGSVPERVALQGATEATDRLLPVIRANASRAVADVLAPNGVPIFEWGHETTPTDGEIRELAERIVAALAR